MVSYYAPDITGVDPDYLQPNLLFYIRKSPYVIYFEASPVYANKIVLSATDGSGTLLVQGVDWVVNPTDIDEAAMSRAYLEYPQFAQTLVKSVTIISTTFVNKRIAATVQEFYLTQPGRPQGDGTPLQVTPDLIAYLSESVADTRRQLAGVTSPVVPFNGAPTLLPFDINAELPGNVIPGEMVNVNTLTGAKVVRLNQGAYFADSLTITYNGAPLNSNTDYLPIVVSPLTKDTVNPGGIYQFVLITAQVTGQVSVTYHAVGGDVNRNDMSAIYGQLVGIQSFLSENVFITADNIALTPAFRAFNARLNLQETNMRNLLTGAPTYGDATAGTAVRRPVQTQDANFHWWTIANLYKVQGSNDVVTTDQFRGRVFFPGAEITLAFIVDINLSQTRQPVSFKTETLVFDPTYTLYGTTSVNAPVYPMLRAVWSNASQGSSGISLQIGLPLTLLSDQMVVEDVSTTQSCWLLDQTGAYIPGQTPTPSLPRDDNFTLPDGQTLWSSASTSSVSKTYVPQYTPGYLVYTGSNVTLAQLVGNASTTGLFNILLPSYFPITNITSLVFSMASTDGTIKYDLEIPLPSNQMGRQSFTDSQNDMIAMTASIAKSNTNVITLNVNVANNSNNSSTLTDIVRYVRAKCS